jgi:probable addiction module antidote protein
MAKKEYRKFREYEEDYFRKNPDEIDDYLKEVFDEYAEDGNTPALLSSLRVISRVKGISEISRETGITRNGIQKALSEEGNPRLESINAIMHAMGYRLKPEKLQLPGA